MIKNINKGVFAAISLVLLLNSAGQAAEKPKVVNLSMQNAVEIALRNNLNLKIDSFTPEIKQLDLQKIYDQFGFSVGFSPRLQNNVRANPNSFLTGTDVNKDFSQNYDFYARKDLLSNGQISLEFQNGIVNTNNTRANFNPALSPSLGVSFSQPILKNAFNGYRQVSIGKNETFTSNLRLKSSAITVASQTQAAYWNLVLSRERLKVLESSLTLTRNLLKINQEKEKAGVIAKIEVLNTEANIAASEESLLQGRLSVGDSEDALKKLLNPDAGGMGWDFTINTPAIPEITGVSTDFSSSFDKSVNNRPDYQAVVADRHTLALQSEIANQNRYPELTVNGGIGLNSLNNNYFTALGNLLSLQTYNWNLGLNLEIPVVGNPDEITYRQTLLNIEKQDVTINNFKQTMFSEVRNAIRSVQINEKRVEANKLSRKLMNEQVKAETEKFNLGLSTNYQVLQLQRDLQQASLNEVNARVDYLKSLDELSRVEGLSLEKNNIIWDNNYNRAAASREK